MCILYLMKEKQWRKLLLNSFDLYQVSEAFM